MTARRASSSAVEEEEAPFVPELPLMAFEAVVLWLRSVNEERVGSTRNELGRRRNERACDGLID